MSENATPSLRDRIDHYLRLRFHKEIRWWHVHLFLVTGFIILLVLAIGFGAGFWQGESFAQKQQQKLESRVVAAQLTPPTSRALAPRLYAPPTTSTGSVYLKYLDPPGNQGQVGSCQCWAFRRLFDYLYNVRNKTFRHFSCRFWYTIATHGIDTGSNFMQYPPILASLGAVRENQYTWLVPPTQEDPGVPQSVLNEALAHRYSVTTTVIQGDSMGGGMNAVYGAEFYISRHVPVNFDMPVWSAADQNGYFNVSPTHDFVDNPTDTSSLVGGHANVLFAFDKKKCMNGTCGWFRARNQWGCEWGQCGDYWVSERFVATYGWGIEVIHLTKINPTATLGKQKPFTQPGPVLDKPLPPPPVSPRLQPGCCGNWTGYVRAHDVCSNGVWSFSCQVFADLAPDINAAAHANKISAPGLLSVLGAECGLFTHSNRCDRYGVPPDVSFGGCQVTVETALEFGVGGGNTEAVRAYENLARQCVWLAARVLGSYKHDVAEEGCIVDFPNLYVAWNAGPYTGCAFILSPYGQAGSNYYGNYLGWWRWALGYSFQSNPYHRVPPPKFPYALWCRWDRAHHVRCASTWVHHQRIWQASAWLHHEDLGSYKSTKDRWNRATKHRVGYTRYSFQCGAIFAWSRYHTTKAVLRPCHT